MGGVYSSEILSGITITCLAGGWGGKVLAKQLLSLKENPRLYSEFAPWWPALSAPEEYAEEAAFFWKPFQQYSPTPPQTMLELGSGGGNNASHLKQRLKLLTLVDRSPGMLAVSRELNPECQHFEGDMRSVRLGRTFDAVFIHDAIMYLLTLADLRLAFDTAYAHCKPGGTALFVPDCVRETFRPNTDCGGHDRPERAMRYLEWTYDPDPADSTFLVDFAYLLREAGGQVRCEYDRHTFGLFALDDWLATIAAAGFEPHYTPFVHSEVEPGSGYVFIGVKK